MTAFQAEGCGIALSGDEYIVSVTGFTFYVIWHDRHSADWLAALASPYPAAPDFPLCRGQNKTPRNTLFINGSTVSTGYSATVEVLHRTSKWGEVRPRRTMVSFISMFTLVHPFATTWHFPSRGNEKFRGAFLLPPHRTAGGKVVRSTEGGCLRFEI